MKIIFILNQNEENNIFLDTLLKCKSFGMSAPFITLHEFANFALTQSSRKYVSSYLKEKLNLLQFVRAAVKSIRINPKYFTPMK